MKKRKDYFILKTFLIILIVIMVITTIFIIKLCMGLPYKKNDVPTLEHTENILPSNISAEITETTVETIPEPEHVVSIATIGAMGDLLMHEPLFSSEGRYNAVVQQTDGSYDFDSMFRYVSEYTDTVDYAVINLETTLASNTNGYPYHGYPLFNCPDEIVDGVKDAGFDMILTANNHSYDTGLIGYKRTIEVIREKGLENLGTYSSPSETKWTIVNVNDINIGMLAYTYATGVTEDGRPALNDNAAISEPEICNYFYSGNLDAFYREVETHLEEMKQAGAEKSIMYIHWGREYELIPNNEQQVIAQKLCDLGIDVIIGGHPHVLQPIALLESSTNPNHKTVCLYSTGNAVSNQRLGYISAMKTAHTEDGVLFTVTFEKYSDGTVYLAGVNALPTWVNKHTNSVGKIEYNILPLDYERIDEWANWFEVDGTTLNAAKESYARTMDILKVGLEEVTQHFVQEKSIREDIYQKAS